MKAIGYIRVSTEEQAKDGVSLDNQRAKIQAYCALNDMELVGVVEDGGRSGKDLNREGLQKVLDMIHKKEVSALVVYKLDRLSRKVRDITNLIDMFEKYNISFHSVIEKIDTKTAMSKFFINIMGSISQLERDVTSERTKDALNYSY